MERQPGRGFAARRRCATAGVHSAVIGTRAAHPIRRDVCRSRRGSPVSFVYHLRNAGDRDLEIKAIHKRCTCIKTTKPESPIPPGGEGTVEVEFSTENREGPFFHQLLVETNDPLLPVAKLKATGYIDTGVTALPAHIDLGDVAFGEERTKACIVKYAGVSEEFTVGGVSCDSALIELRDFNPDSADAADLLWPDAAALVVGASVRRVFVVTFKPTREQLGEIRANVKIETNAEGFERVVVPVTGRVVPPVRVYPSTLSFGEVASGEEIERTVTALSPTGRPFRIAGTLPEHDGLRISAGDTDEQGELAVRFVASGAAALALADEELALDVEMTDTGERFPVPLRVYALDADRDVAHEPHVTESGG